MNVTCGHCGNSSQVDVYPSVNVGEEPELKARVISGELFVHECPHCGSRELLRYDMLYHDPEERLLLCLSDKGIRIDDMRDYTGRIVPDAGTLIEKIKIFDAGLDDVVMELCKLITVQELGRDVDLKFFGMDGADNDLTLAYPENGRMEMLKIGFNVYEDCAGIVNRNPGMREGSRGLARIDRDWLSGYVG